MNPKKQVSEHLQAMKKTTVHLSELESLIPGHSCSYEQFAAAVLELEADGMLQMVKSKGRTSKQPSLAYQYKVMKAVLNEDFHRELNRARLHLHPLIQLDAYYSLTQAAWERDYPYIQRIDTYMKHQALPEETAAAPERSFDLVADEKWITEKRGEELLKRTGLWDKLRIMAVPDPLMMAFNPACMGSSVHKHLIVENKTAYRALLPALSDVPFTTLIYGCGNKIVKSIETFHEQLPLPGGTHCFYYFGDLDKEGISIWHRLDGKVQDMPGARLRPALPFYEALLKKNFARGKETQRDNAEAVQAFLQYFTAEYQELVRTCLDAGGYYPQEYLHTQELCQLWRTVQWST